MTTVTTAIPPVAKQHLPLDLFETTKDGKNWVLDTATGSTARFEVNGTPSIVPDDTFGSALTLNGKDTAIDLGRIGDLIPGSANQQQAVSVTMWVKLADKNQKNKVLVGVEGGWSLELDENQRPQFAVSGAAAGMTRTQMAAATARVPALEAQAQASRLEAARQAEAAVRSTARLAETDTQLAILKAQRNSIATFLRSEFDVTVNRLQADRDRQTAEIRTAQAASQAAQAQAEAAARELAEAKLLSSLAITAQGPALKDRRWTHVAAVFDGTSVVLYVDGVEAAATGTDGRATTIRHRADARLLIGAQADGGGRLAGQVARFSQYDQALTPAEIQILRAADQTVQAAFRGRYPFSFDLLDDEVRDVIYISDVGVQTATVTVTNTSAAPLTLRKIDPALTLDANNHHLELRFRPGTFRPRKRSDHAVAVKNAPRGAWKVSDGPVAAADKVSTSLYLAYTGGRDKVMAPGDTLTFDLEYQSADGQLGSRGTNVVLGYRHLTWEGSDHTAIDVSGERIRSVDVINRSGKQNLPLHVGFVGSNRILNVAAAGAEASGSTGTLLIRLLNSQAVDDQQPDKNRLDLKSITGRDTGSADQATKFTVSFDVDGDWALTDTTKSQAVELQWRVKRGGRYSTKQTALRDTQGSGAVWTFNPDFDGLRAGEFIDLELTGITTTQASGLSNIYIHYEDIPGYWDGQFVLAVEKSPLAFSNDRVGIARYPATDGTGNRNVDLAVAGRLRSDSSNGGMWVQGHGFFGGHSTNKLGIYNGGGWGLTVDNARNVGIGTHQPEYRLHIVGSSDAELASGGTLVIGTTTGTNLAMDSNEIMARNNSSASTLYLNNNGGLVEAGEGGIRSRGNLTVSGRMMVGHGIIQRGGTQLTSTSDLGLYSQVRNNWIRIVTNNAPIKFYTDSGIGSTPRMTIYSGGNVETGNLNVKGHADIVNYLNFNYGSKQWRFGFTGNGLHVSYNDTRVMHFYENGDLQQLRGRWHSPSDAALKEQIVDLDQPLDIVDRLRPRRFRWKESGALDLGFVAQEVQAVLPELVEENLKGPQGLSYNQFIAVAIGAIQQQQEQIESLTAKLEDMERRSP